MTGADELTLATIDWDESDIPDKPCASAAPLRDGHVLALDGLRAVFVVAVIAYHLGYSWARGGFLGVDAFFGLSGYLITRLLLEEHARSHGIDIVRFWLRRVRRLFPALILVLLAVAAATALWTDPTQYRGVRGDALSGLLYVANWRFILAGQSYFDLFSAPSPLRHLWSLAIEEQFYLVWPLVLFACFRLAGGRAHDDDAERRGRRAALGVCLGGIAVSAVLMALWFVPGDPSRVYYGTDTRAQTILVGCVLALLTTRRPIRMAASRAASSVGTVAVIVMVAAFVFVADTDARIYRGGSVVFALIVACVLWYVTSRPSVIARALAVRPLVFIGTISYGLYLWHWPAIVFMTPANVHLSGWHLDAARIIVTFAAAVLSYRFVERPIRLNSSRVSTTWAVAAIAVVAGLFLAVTAGAKPLPNYLGGQAAPNGRCAETQPATLNQARALYAASGQRVTYDNPLRGKRILVIGDSTACSLVVGLQVIGEAYGATIGNGTVVGCGIVSGRVPAPYGIGTQVCPAKVHEAEAAGFAEVRPDIVLWTSQWERGALLKNGHTLDAGTPAWTKELNDRILAAVHRFHADGARVVFVTEPPIAPGPSIFGDNALHGATPASDPSFTLYNDLLRQFVAQHPAGVSLVDLAGYVCPSGAPCPPTVDGFIPRYDGEHYATRGAVWAAEWLVPRLAD